MYYEDYLSEKVQTPPTLWFLALLRLGTGPGCSKESSFGYLDLVGRISLLNRPAPILKDREVPLFAVLSSYKSPLLLCLLESGIAPNIFTCFNYCECKILYIFCAIESHYPERTLTYIVKVQKKEKMAPKCKIILDTDPGVDDVMALLLALSASPEELELAMISVTYGNVPLEWYVFILSHKYPCICPN